MTKNNIIQRKLIYTISDEKQVLQCFNTLYGKKHWLVIKNGVCVNSQLSYSTINNPASVCICNTPNPVLPSVKSFEMFGLVLDNIPEKCLVVTLN